MKKIIVGIGGNLFILIATYLITILALFMFKSTETMDARIQDTIAITTITYCFGTIAHNILEKKGIFFALGGIVLLIIYMIIYISVKNATIALIWFKLFSYSLIVLIALNDVIRIIRSHYQSDENNIIHALSA